jgi:CHRD domain
MNVLTPRSLASALAALTLGSICSSAPQAAGQDDDDRSRGVLTTRLSGFNEVHFSAGPPATLRGAVSTKGTGRFRAAIHDRRDMIEYELNYSDLEGTVTQAHIHFGQAHTVGGIVVWLCQTTGTPAPANVAAATPICPQDTAGGPVTGTITPAQVLAQTAQGISAGEFDELVRAIRAGATYFNVHSSLHPPGEIRGQLRDRRHQH